MLSEKDNKGISVIICCYNSEARLPETLSYLRKQKLDATIPWEVIVIDNNSTDGTAQVAITCWSNDSAHGNLKVILELKPGLSYAREKGFVSAQYEYILLCDDDNWLEENYLQLAFNHMESNKLIGALGGQSEDVCEIAPPFWFDYLKSSYAIGPQASTSGDITETRGYLWGAGLMLRKSIWEQLRQRNFESILSDRKGKTVASGGDGELCYAIRLLGYKLYYDEDLKFKHFMAKGRLTWDYYKKLLQSFGRARVYLGLYEYVIQNKKGQSISPKHYWRANIRAHLSVLYVSYRLLLKSFFKEKIGDSSIINPQMKLAGLLELLKIRSNHQAYIKQIETTFSKNI